MSLGLVVASDRTDDSVVYQKACLAIRSLRQEGSDEPEVMVAGAGLKPEAFAFGAL
jgi:hypothetical protein